MRKRKVYARYPKMADLMNEISPEVREVIRNYHQIMLQGFEGYVKSYPSKAKDLGDTSQEVLSGQRALRGWRRILHDVNELISNPGPADWCCPAGMLAYPKPCPSHGEIEDQ